MKPCKNVKQSTILYRKHFSTASLLTNDNTPTPIKTILDVDVHRNTNKEKIKTNTKIYTQVRKGRLDYVSNKGQNTIDPHDGTPKSDVVEEEEINRVCFKHNNIIRYSVSNRYINRASISNNSVIETNTNDYVADTSKEMNNNDHTANLKNDIFVVASD